MEETTTAEKPKMTAKTIIVRIIIGLALCAGLFFGGKKIYYELHHETTDNAQVEAKLVPILPRVSGYVIKLYPEDYSSVKKDSLIAELDDTELQLQLQEMEADLVQAQSDIANAQASLANAAASINESQSNVTVAQTRLDKANQDYARDQNLYRDGAITKKQLDDSKSVLDVAQKQFDAAKSDVTVAQSRVGVINAQLKKADAIIKLKQANIEQQKLKISYTKIYATSDGKIGKRNVDLGQFVQAGTPLFTIVDDESFWVVANYKETQIQHMKVGDEAELSIEAYPNMKLKGKVVSLSDATGARFSLLPPDNATGNFVKVTQRVPVKIEIEDESKYKDLLHAGLSVDVAIAY